jgi:CRP-like cAMP-binding protein
MAGQNATLDRNRISLRWKSAATERSAQERVASFLIPARSAHAVIVRFGKEDRPRRLLPKIPQETLAEMLGTTRTRVKYFMGKFRKLGFIKYNGGLQINASPLSVVLQDETPTAWREVYLALGR